MGPCMQEIVDVPVAGPMHVKALLLLETLLFSFGKDSPAGSAPSQEAFVLEPDGAPPTGAVAGAVLTGYLNSAATPTAVTPKAPMLLASNSVANVVGTDLYPNSPVPHSGVGSDGVDLSSDGLLSSPCVGSETHPGSPYSCSVDPALSPRLVMDMFPVSLSPVSKMGSLRAVDSLQLGVGLTAPQGFTGFRSSCRRPISPVLPRPPTRRCRPRKVYSGPVRRSRRIGGRFAAGTPIRQQQRTLISRLGLACEGEVIGDEALDAYLDLFARPLRQQHIDVILRLFGWQPDALPLSDEALVECMV
jgi:hypothetical protein